MGDLFPVKLDLPASREMWIGRLFFRDFLIYFSWNVICPPAVILDIIYSRNENGVLVFRDSHLFTHSPCYTCLMV